MGWVGFQKYYVILRVGHGKCLRLITTWVGGVKKGQKHAYVILEWSLICLVTLLVKRDATHRNALETIPLETLKQFDDRRLNPANINTTGRNEL